MNNIAASLLLSLTLGGGTLSGQTGYVPTAALAVPSGKIVVIAHRGEHLHHPENTLPAFMGAIAAGADYFELDVRTTSDGKFVIMHDRTLDRTTNGKGEVSNATFDEIRALDAGTRFSSIFAGTKVPTLDEAFDAAHGKINVYVDVKAADPQLLVDTIVKHEMQDHVVVYGAPSFLREVQKIHPRLRVMPEASSLDNCKLLAQSLHVPVFAFDAGDFNDAVIHIAKEAGAQIFVDRLDDADRPEIWQKAIDAGTNGIQTNLPAELAAYLRGRNLSTH